MSIFYFYWQEIVTLVIEFSIRASEFDVFSSQELPRVLRAEAPTADLRHTIQLGEEARCSARNEHGKRFCVWPSRPLQRVSEQKGWDQEKTKIFKKLLAKYFTFLIVKIAQYGHNHTQNMTVSYVFILDPPPPKKPTH